MLPPGEDVFNVWALLTVAMGLLILVSACGSDQEHDLVEKAFVLVALGMISLFGGG